MILQKQEKAKITENTDKVGKDMYGAYLKNTLRQEEIGTAYLLEDEK